MPEGLSEIAILTLSGIGAIAASFAGFSGVVVVFGERSHGDWLSKDRFRLVIMLAMSLSCCFFSFTPMVLNLFQVPPRQVWVYSSSLLGVSFFSFYMYVLPQSLRLMRYRMNNIDDVFSIVIIFVVSTAITMQALNATGLWFEIGPGAFVIGLLSLLFVSGIEFARLVLSPIKNFHTRSRKPQVTALRPAKPAKGTSSNRAV